MLGYLLVLLNLAAACTHTKPGPASDKSIDASPNGNAVIVQQAGSERAIVSPFDRQYFIDARKSLPAGEARLYATLATGAADAAEQEARALLAKAPNNASALLVLASALVLQRKYPLAAFYAKMLGPPVVPTRRPDSVGTTQLEAHVENTAHADALNIRGLANLYSGRNTLIDYKRSLELFQRSFQASSIQLASGLNLAHLQLEMGQAQAASETFSQVTTRNPHCTQAWLGYGIAKTRLGDYKEASLALQTILDRDTNNPEALYYLALIKRNGYNDSKSAGSVLRRILAGNSASRTIRQKSQSLLRLIEGEATQAELVRDQKEDAELIMTNMSKHAGDDGE